MKVQTKFEKGQKVYFYDMGEINKGKITHIAINLNSGEVIEYTIERRDKTWKKHGDYIYYYPLSLNEYQRPRTTFIEDEIADSKKDMITLLKNKEYKRHEEEIEKINNL